MQAKFHQSAWTTLQYDTSAIDEYYLCHSKYYDVLNEMEMVMPKFRCALVPLAYHTVTDEVVIQQETILS